MVAAIGALVFAALSGYRLVTVWHGLPEHLRSGSGRGSPRRSPLHGVLKVLAVVCLGWVGGAAILFGDALRPEDSPATHPGYILTVVGVVLLVLGVIFVVTILRWRWPEAMVPHPYRHGQS